MITVMAATLAMMVQVPPTTTELGRISMRSGYCQRYGWVNNDAELERVSHAVADRISGMSADEVALNIDNGARLEQQRLKATEDAVKTLADFNRWAERAEAMCDALVRDYPALISRGPNTASTWEAYQARYRGLFN